LVSHVGSALLSQVAEHIEAIELLLRSDSAGASHELLDWCHDARIRFSVGYDSAPAALAISTVASREPESTTSTCSREAIV